MRRNTATASGLIDVIMRGIIVRIAIEDRLHFGERIVGVFAQLFDQQRPPGTLLTRDGRFHRRTTR